MSKNSIHVYEKNNKVRPSDNYFSLPPKDNQKSKENIKITYEKPVSTYTPLITSNTVSSEKSTFVRTTSVSSLSSAKYTDQGKRYFSPKNQLVRDNKILDEIKKLKIETSTQSILSTSKSTFLGGDLKKTNSSLTNLLVRSPSATSKTTLIKPGLIKNDFYNPLPYNMTSRGGDDKNIRISSMNKIFEGNCFRKIDFENKKSYLKLSK